MAASGNEHKPTPETRNLVRTLTGFGIEQEHISAKLGISHVTLRKHYRAEIDAGTPDLIAAAAASLYKRMMDPKGGMPAVTAAIFILKARGKWRDAQVVEHTDGNGNPLQADKRPIVVMLPDNGRSEKPMKLVTPKTIEGEAIEVK